MCVCDIHIKNIYIYKLHKNCPCGPRCYPLIISQLWWTPRRQEIVGASFRPSCWAQIYMRRTRTWVLGLEQNDHEWLIYIYIYIELYNYIYIECIWYPVSAIASTNIVPVYHGCWGAICYNAAVTCCHRADACLQVNYMRKRVNRNYERHVKHCRNETE